MRSLAGRLLWVLIVVLCVPATLVMAETAGTAEQGERKLTITVVEDLPAVDIEDNAVPLAAFPAGEGRDGIRHAVLMGVVLAAVIGYIWYFSRYERRLLVLRRRAASAQLRKMTALRRGRTAGDDGDER